MKKNTVAILSLVCSVIGSNAYANQAFECENSDKIKLNFSFNDSRSTVTVSGSDTQGTLTYSGTTNGDFMYRGEISGIAGKWTVPNSELIANSKLFPLPNVAHSAGTILLNTSVYYCE